MTCDKVVTAARSLLGTPYILGYAKPGLGCDCIGVVEFVLSALRGGPQSIREPFVGDYYDDPRDLLLNGAKEHLTEIDRAVVGCVLVFRLKNKPGCSHIGICSEIKNGLPYRFIHAHDGRKIRKVVETTLGPRWLPNLAGKFLI